MKYYDVCIIGGGAAGLSAAVTLDKGIDTCILEKNTILGRKLMATGGGRCNITNAACENKDETLGFFDSLGLVMYQDSEGRYYPYSNQASDVVAVLEHAVRERNADIITGFGVKNLCLKGGSFQISDGERVISSSKLLIATGGKAAPAFGTTGDGYGFAKALGHTVNRVYPILTGIECGDFNAIKGIRARGRVSLYRSGIHLKSETGEIQFTADGISGICVFNLTPYIKCSDGEQIKDALKEYELVLDLAPDIDDETIVRRKESFGILTKKLAEYIPLKTIKAWKLPVCGVKGWKNAQCTGGGIPAEELCADTMESCIMPNLYFAGEIVDRHGPCGGFNLQYAWESGIKAAKAINRMCGK